MICIYTEKLIPGTSASGIRCAGLASIMALGIFISFEHHSKHHATWLSRQLIDAGFATSIEDDFGARPPRQEISQAIQECDIFIALVTPQYPDAKAPKRELDYAEAFDKKIISLFMGIPSRGTSAGPYAAYRRIELEGEWTGSDEQRAQVLELLLRALHAESERLAKPATESAEPTLSSSLTEAVLIYDLEDRFRADGILARHHRWLRFNGSTGDNGGNDQLPHVLLWTTASAEPDSRAYKAFLVPGSDLVNYVLVVAGSPMITAANLPVDFTLLQDDQEATRNVSTLSTGSAARAVVRELTKEVYRRNGNVPLDVFLDRFCRAADVADVTGRAYSIAIKELQTGEVARLEAAYNHTLALRFHGFWRTAVDVVENELLTLPAQLTSEQDRIKLRLQLEKASLQYELGDRRTSGITSDIEAAQLRFRKLGDLHGYVQAGRMLGDVLKEQGDFLRAQHVMERTIGVAEYLAEDSENNYGFLLLADGLRELAQLQITRLNFDEARTALDEAATCLAPHTDTHRDAVEYLAAVLTYVEATLAELTQHESEPLIERMQAALDAISRFENPIRVATIYNWLGRAWSKRVPSRKDDLVLAEKYLRRALRIRESHGHSYTLGVSYISLGELYEKLGDPARAISNYQEGRSIFNERGLRPALANANATLARAYYRLSHSPEDSAARNYKSYLEFAEQQYREMQLDTEGLELRFELEHGGRKPVDMVPDDTLLISVGEYHLHKWIREYTAVHAANMRSGFRLLTGIGDDAAVIAFDGNASNIGLVYTTDAAPGSLAVPGRSPEYLGRFTVVQTLGDVIAMGGIPISIMLNLFLSRGVTVGYARRLIEAVVKEAARYGATVIGGDVKERSEQSVGCVGIGYVETNRILTRNAVRPGHAIGITLASDPSGTGHRRIGARWAQELVEYYQMDDESLIASFPTLAEVIDPTAKYELLYLPDKVMRIAAKTGLLKAAMDTSDGVLACLEILGRESQVGFRLDEAPIADQIDARARILADILGIPPALFIFSAGHDWEIVFSCEESDFETIAAAVSQELSGNGKVVKIGVATQRSAEDERGISIIGTDGALYGLPFYTDEKFVPRRYQDRPSQWLGFASRLTPKFSD
jgi:thiamine monophosphate kinase/tetratricopeptide (TPR) repeat protein